MTFSEEREPQYVLTGLSVRNSPVLRDALHQHLAAYNDRGNTFPQLAVELPSRAKGTWVIRPDGTMQTTFLIHTNVTWHDGAPLTVQDFLFGWTVVMDSDLPIESRAVARQITRIDTPDDFTLVIEWAGLYAGANDIINDDVGPFPLHLLKGLYESDKERFRNSPYWNREFVGVGPYKLVDWQPGSQVQMEAYDGFYAGRPKIDRITLLFLSGDETMVTNLLAGTLDSASGLGFNLALLVKQEWERAGQKPTAISQTGGWRHVWVQQRDPAVRELQDMRLRRGLLAAIDRQALVDAIYGAPTSVADTFIPPDDFRWDWVKDVIVRYPYDPRQAEELLTQAGLRRGPDGVFVTAAGARMVLPQWTTPGPENVQELAITADQWKTAGILTEQVVLSSAQQNDLRLRATFPALFHLRWGRLDVPNLEFRFHSSQCPTEQNGWTGLNQGCYLNPEADPIVARLKAAIDPEEQRLAYRDLTRLYTGELPMLPLFFTLALSVVREGITGVRGLAKPEGGITWNIAEWDME